MRSHRPLQMLKDKSGASMLFVLGMMLLFMAIGVSALAAASANAGTDLNQRTYNQLAIYADSAQKSIMCSLQESGNDAIEKKRVDRAADNLTPPETLGGQIIKALYHHKLDQLSGVAVEPLVLDLTMTLDGEAEPVPVTVNVAFEDARVEIVEFEGYVEDEPDEPATPNIDEYQPAIDARPSSASIRANVIFTIRADDEKGRAVTYVLAYRLSGVDLMMGGYAATLTADSGTMEIIDAGTWRVMAYDKSEN